MLGAIAGGVAVRGEAVAVAAVVAVASEAAAEAAGVAGGEMPVRTAEMEAVRAAENGAGAEPWQLLISVCGDSSFVVAFVRDLFGAWGRIWDGGVVRTGLTFDLSHRCGINLD